MQGPLAKQKFSVFWMFLKININGYYIMQEVALLRSAFVNLYFSLLQVLQVLQDGSPPFRRAPRAEYKKAV